MSLGDAGIYFYFYFFSLFFNFYFYFILLYNTVLVLPYIDMNPPRVYMHSQTWTPLPWDLFLIFGLGGTFWTGLVLTSSASPSQSKNNSHLKALRGSSSLHDLPKTLSSNYHSFLNISSHLSLNMDFHPQSFGGVSEKSHCWHCVRVSLMWPFHSA